MAALSTTWSLIVLAQAPAAAPAPAGERPAELVGRVNGAEIGRAEFSEWLLETHGWRHFDDFVDLQLARAEAGRVGIALPTPAEVEAAFEEDWRDQILLRHRGREEKFVAELAEAGLAKSDYRDRRFGSLELEVVAKRIVRERLPTEAQLQELWKREFGREGVRRRLRIAFFDRLRGVAPGITLTKDESRRVESEVEAAARRFHATVSADRARFAADVATESDPCLVLRFDSIPTDLRRSAGELPRLHDDHFGGALRTAVANAKPGELLDLVATPQGYYVVELLESAAAPFAATRDELLEIWRTRFPSLGEVHALKQELRQRATIERLPLSRAGAGPGSGD